MKLPPIAIAFSLLFCAPAGCGRERPPPAETSPPLAVRIAPVTKKVRAAGEEVVGTVRPKLQAVSEAKVSGRIETRRCSPLSVVSKS